MSGKKYDDGKRRWGLLPFEAVELVVEVLEHGAEKYGANNWQGLEDFDRRYYEAALRHLFAWWGGERFDPDSGLPHIAHATCCLVFLCWRELQRQRADLEIRTDTTCDLELLEFKVGGTD